MLRVASVVAGTTTVLLLAGPVAAVQPADDLTEFMIPNGPGAGLIAVSRGVSGSQVDFTVSGLQSRTKYTMVVSKKGCATARGTIVRGAFITDRRGVALHSLRTRSDAKPKSVRILKGRQMIECNPVGTRRKPPVGVVTVGQPKAVVTISQASMWSAALAVAGLDKNTRYHFAGVQGGCASNAKTLIQGRFTTDRKGFGMLNLQVSPKAGYAIDSVLVEEQSTAEVAFCETL